MTPARSVAASVVALGFAGTLTVPLPALAALPAACDRLEHYAAQAGAELLRIDRLDPGSVAGRKPAAANDGAGSTTSSTPKTLSGTNKPGDVSNEPDLTTDDSETPPADEEPADDQLDDLSTTSRPGDVAAGEQSGWSTDESTGGQGGGAGDQAVGNIGIGDARSVLIADGPVNSAGAARTLDGTVAGSTGSNDLVVQQAPPVNPKPVERRTGSKKFGAMHVGAGTLRARAAWVAGMECGSTEGEASSASAEVSRVTIAGGGSAALVRVPERVAGRSSTALRRQAGSAQTVATATLTAGRISLVDNEVRLRVLRAPELRVSMTAGGQSKVDYRPAVVEVASRGGKKARLATARDHIDITLSNETPSLESLPVRVEPAGKLPLPNVPNLPVPSDPETSPVPAETPGTTLRISLGNVRQATGKNAIAARATAIRVTLVRNMDKTQNGSGNAPSGVVADLGIGVLEAAAMAPTGRRSGTTSNGDTTGSSNNGTDSGSKSAPTGGAGAGMAGAGLPITGPGVVPLFLAGAGLVIGGIGAVALTSRRRRRNAP